MYIRLKSNIRFNADYVYMHVTHGVLTYYVKDTLRKTATKI